MNQKKELHKIAEQCIWLSQQKRPEVIWLQEKHHQLQIEYNLKNKTETDRMIYETMYHKKAEELHKLTKLRYWRTGRSVPGNREQCFSYGTSLHLSETDMKYLIQSYYDRSLYLYDRTSTESPDYQKKYEEMKKLTKTYLQKIPTDRLLHFQIPPENRERFLRHLYFTDAFHYVHTKSIPTQTLIKHITSTRYDSEFTRHRKIMGEIPRTHMIRHLLILGLPEITLEQLNKELSFFDYLPLTESHTLVGGEHLDWMLIQLFELYKTHCHSFSPKEKLSWFQQTCKILDQHFLQKGYSKLRFMHFKALDL